MNCSEDTLLGRKIRVYRNLHKNLWSILDVKERKVVTHLHTLNMTQAVFIVSEAGRKRVLKEKRKNVHAFIQGYLDVEYKAEPTVLTPPRQAYYNPYKQKTFTDRLSGTPLGTAYFCNFRVDGTVFYANTKAFTYTLKPKMFDFSNKKGVFTHLRRMRSSEAGTLDLVTANTITDTLGEQLEAELVCCTL